MPSPPDTTLVERAAAGDAKAFDELGRGAIDRMYAIANRILRDPDSAQDAVQQALWAAWRDLPNLRDPSRFEAWLRRLLVRCCYEEANRRRRVHLMPLRAPQEASHVDEITAVGDREALDQAFALLTTEHRAVVVLHHWEGLTLVEIADALAIPVGTARSRLHYALRRLRESLGPDRAATRGATA
jgi:RNA polymerase sigma-70 factor (ECF subfamily)